MKIGDFVWILEHIVLGGYRFRMVDQYDLNAPLLKRDAARMLHEALEQEYAEEDEEDWSAARALQDLFDCGMCVWHSAQMYCKGIMPADAPEIFGSTREVSPEEAREYVDRLMHHEKRVPPAPVQVQPVREITLEEMEGEILSARTYRLIDVRTPAEHRDRPVKNSVNIPMRDIFLNPHCIQAHLGETLYLYCGRGYRSGIAAQAMMNAGFPNVVVVKDA